MLSKLPTRPCACALILRAELEQLVKAAHEPAARKPVEDAVAKLKDWLTREGLARYLSDHEQALLNKRPGTWSQQELIEASWRAEALGVILWSLQLIGSLPPYDAGFSLDLVKKSVSLFHPTGDFVQGVTLRPTPEIARARDLAELWHWRSRTTRLQKDEMRAPEGLTFPEIIKMAAEAAHKDGSIPQVLEEDFPLFGKPYARCSEQEYQQATSIAMERHFALNYLCGSEDWDETPTDT